MNKTFIFEEIATGSVVTTNINENEIWGGNPAKFIKYREY